MNRQPDSIQPTPAGRHVNARRLPARPPASERRWRHRVAAASKPDAELQEQFRATFEQAAVGMAHVALDGTWLRVNARLRDIVGYSPEQLRGLTFQDITHPDDLDADLDLVAQLVAGEIPTYAMEKRYIRRDGSTVWTRLTVSLVRDTAGAPSYFISVVEDIHARKQAELALRNSEDRLRLALSAASMGSWDLDVRSGVLTCSPQQLVNLGVPPGTEMSRTLFFSLIHEDDEAQVRTAFNRSIAGEEPYLSEFRVVWPDGSTHWLLSVGQPIRERNITVRVSGLTLDITERKLEERRQHFLTTIAARIEHTRDPDALVHAILSDLSDYLEVAQTILAEVDQSHGTVTARWAMPEINSAELPLLLERALLDHVREQQIRGETIVVRNVLEDDRFGRLVERIARIPSRAGIAVPLRRDGVWTATLIVIANAPRSWRTAEISLVESVSDRLRLALENIRLYHEAIAALATRNQTLVALSEREEQMRMALDAANMSAWKMDIPSGRRTAIGLTQHTIGANADSLEDFLQLIHEDDRERVIDAIRNTSERGDLYEVEFRARRTDGGLRWIVSRGRLVRNDVGRADHVVGIAMDVTERKSAEFALHDSEARFRTLTEALPQIVFSAVTPGALEYVNSRWCAFTGMTVTESLDDGWFTAVHAGDLPRLLSDWRDAGRDAEPLECEIRLRGASGELRWFLTRIIPVIDDSGEIGRWFGTSTDIDARKLSEERLVRSERVFRSLVEAAAQVIWSAGPDGRSNEPLDAGLPSSTGFAAFTGVSLGESQGMNWIDRIHPDDRDRVRAEWLARVADGEPYTAEYRVTRHDGLERIVVDRGVPVRDDNGRIERWIGALADITERREAEAQVRLSESRFRRLFEANVIGVCFWSHDRRITDGNDAFLELIGETRERIAAGLIDWRSITPPEWRAADRSAARELYITGACAPFEAALLHRNGTNVPVMIAAALFPGSSDEGIALVIDLTGRKEQERFEQEFLAGLAHDLKNPLAAMKAQAQLMRRRLRTGRLDETLTGEGLVAIETNVTRVARRIEELTDMALLRSGRLLDLVIEPVDLVALVTARTETYRLATERHRIMVDATPSEIVGQWDAGRIERTIDNLLSNAITYSPNGGDIRITIRRDDQIAEFSVADEGVGIPAADIDHIFERYHRGSNVQGRMRGSGIGLAGVRQLVGQHGGTITVHSIEGEGSIFTVRLPLRPD